MRFRTLLTVLALALAGSAGMLVVPGHCKAAAAQAQQAGAEPPAGTNEALRTARDHIKNQQFDEALGAVAKLIANEYMPPPYMAAAFLLRGAAYQGLRKDKAALTAFHEALWLDALPPGFTAQTHFLRAQSLLALGRVKEALKDARLAEGLAPQTEQYAQLREALEKTGGGPGDITASIGPTAASEAGGDAPAQRADTSPGGFVIQLGAMDGAQAAREEWKRIKASHGDLLAGLSPDYQTLPDNNQIVRLRAGPARSLQAASDLCARFKVRGQDCFAVKR